MKTVGGSQTTTETIDLNSSSLSGSALDLSAKVDAWPKDDSGCKLSITAPSGTDAWDVTVSFKTEAREEFLASIPDASHATVTGTNSSNKYYDGDAVTLTLTPEKGYELKQLVLKYGSDQTNVTSSTTWKDWTVTWSSTGETTIKTQAIHDDLSVESLVEEIPKTYRVQIDVDTGLELERPSSSSTTVHRRRYPVCSRVGACRLYVWRYDRAVW